MLFLFGSVLRGVFGREEKGCAAGKKEEVRIVGFYYMKGEKGEDQQYCVQNHVDIIKINRIMAKKI